MHNYTVVINPSVNFARRQRHCIQNVAHRRIITSDVHHSPRYNITVIVIQYAQTGSYSHTSFSCQMHKRNDEINVLT